MSDETPPTRIAFCITDLDPGGAERALVQIVTRLDRRRWAPHVFCLDAGGVLVDQLRAAGIEVVCLGASRPRDFLVVWPLYRRLAALRPAILQTFLFHANVIGRLAGAAARVPVIVSGIRVAEKRSGLRLWIDRVTDRLVTRHVCVSRDVADFSIARGGLPREKICVIPNGVDLEKFANAAPLDLTQFGVPRGSRVLLFVGRLDPQKGPLSLLEAAGELFADHSDLHLVMVGDGPLAAELRGWTLARNLESRVHFTGRRENVAGLMRAADLFVLPSQWEGLPNVVLEAMAAGTPIVARGVEGIRDLLGDGKAGVVVPLDGEIGLAHAIRDALRDHQGMRASVAHAQKIVRERFTWQLVAAEYERIYTELVAQFSAGGPMRG
ncbi:MAG TPA: glycosyltransferase [Planctomycetaceae bacterium]|nr:glycosyltransferase [Planctomycetaceae bacterium]